MASFSSSGPSFAMTFGDTRTSESPTEISPRQTSGSRSFVGRPRSRWGSGSVDRRAWRIRYASAGQLVPANNRDADADRAVDPVAVQAETVALMVQALVGRSDRLLETDPDARRFVVVELAPDGLGGELGRLLRALAGDRRGDDQVEV